jgi:hypothetical protein
MKENPLLRIGDPMNPHVTSTQNLPENDPSRPNDDGCILGAPALSENSPLMEHVALGALT